MSKHRGLTVFVAAAFLACLSAPVSTSQQAPAPPKLVLVLSIDQMRFDYLTRLGPLFTGGLRTLQERGAVFSNANYRHSATETGPGHSVILSGRHPSHSGIVANEWYDSFLRRTVNVVSDPVQSPVGGEGHAASPVNALSFTLGDVLKLKSPQSQVVGVSMKDRSAILMAGRRADAAYWYETSGGNFITSTYYMNDAPAWLTAWNNRHSGDQYFGKQWLRMLPDAGVYEKYAGKDAIEGEWDRKDTVFPHNIRGTPPQRNFYDDLRRTPFADEMLLSFALEAMKAHRLGADAYTDIFAVGFSGTDVVGHTYGPDSQEVMDQLLRLDLILGRLFSEIDSVAGLANTLVVLTADHGSLPLVEVLQAQGVDAKRISPKVLHSAVAAALEKRYPGVSGLMAYFATDIYFDEQVIRTNRLDLKEVEKTAIDALLSTGFVEKVYTHADLLGTATGSDPFLTLFRNSFYQPRSPHLNVLIKKHTYVDSRPGGTGHGSAYDYDRHVPIVFMGPGIAPATYTGDSGPEDIAPTLAQLLGLDFPREPDARILSEMLGAATSGIGR